MFLQPRLLVHNPTPNSLERDPQRSNAQDSARPDTDPSRETSNLKHVLRPAKIWGQTINIIPRSECSFRRIELNGRGSSALDAARFKARRQALLHEDTFKIVPDQSGSRAGIWGFENPTSPPARCLPETLAREGMDTGCRIINALTGVEGQVWQDGALIGSRWWRQIPNLQKWVGFLRACAGEANMSFDLNTVPPAENVTFRTDIPPIEFDRERLSALLSPAHILGVAGLLFACITVFLSAQHIRNSVQLHSVQSEIAKTSDATNEILSQRRRALGNMSAATRYQVLGHEGELMLGLDAIGRVLNNKGLRIYTLSYSNRTLSVQFIGTPQIPISQLVADLEASEVLTNVSLDRVAQDRVTVSANIKNVFTLPAPNLAKSQNAGEAP